MKTAEEWAKEAKCDKFHHGECECFDRMDSKLQGSCDEIADLIRVAQRDAIEAAARVAEQVRKNSEPVRYSEQHVYDYDEGAMSASSEILGAIRSLLSFAQSAPR